MTLNKFKTLIIVGPNAMQNVALCVCFIAYRHHHQHFHQKKGLDVVRLSEHMRACVCVANLTKSTKISSQVKWFFA